MTPGATSAHLPDPRRRAAGSTPDVAPAALEADLAHAAALAALAPSSHNSQPWGLARVVSPAARSALSDALRGRGVKAVPAQPAAWLVLARDGRRELRALEAHRLEMHLSCGMYLHLLLAGLAARGWQATVAWCASAARPELALPGWPESWTPLAAVAVSRAPGAADLGDLPGLLRGRITNRAPYRPEPIAPAALDALSLPPARSAFAAPISGPCFITAADQVRAVGRFVSRHAGQDFSHRAAWAETYSYVRFRAPQAGALEDGFPITQLFGPLPGWKRSLLRLALAPRAMSVLARLGVADRIGRALGELVGETPALVWFSFPAEGPSVEAQLAGGAAVMDFWLRATAAGLALHPVSVVLQHPELRRALQQEHGLTGQVFFLSRLGRPATSFPPAPRRSDPMAAVTQL